MRQGEIPELRHCNKCDGDRPLSDFGPTHPHCKPCKNKAEKSRRAKRIEEVRAYDRARYILRRSERLEYCKAYQASGGATAKRKNSSYQRLPESTAESRIEIPVISVLEKRDQKIRRLEINKSGIRKALRDRSRAFFKRGAWRDLIGADFGFVKIQIESHFSEGMNWSNRGVFWHIDHHIPISHFNLNDPAEAKMAFNWRNLRPLEAHKNLEKHDSMPDDSKEFLELLRKAVDIESH